MRILHIIPNLSGGGAERQLSYLAPELVLLGHEVHIAYNHDGPEKPELPNVILHLVKNRSNYDPSILWQLLQIVRQIKPDIIQTWILQSDILGGIISKLTKIPWIFRESTSVIAYNKTWKHRFRRLIASSARAVISNSLGGDMIWENVLPTAKRYVISNGLPLDDINKVTPEMPNGILRQEVPIVLYVGRLIDRRIHGVNKNVKLFINTAAKIRQQQNAKFIICGDGPERTELEIQVHDLGIENDVFFLGYLPAIAIWKLMKMASVFVSLSAVEGCPNSVMEAMACGCSLVVSDIPAHHEILDNQSANFVNQEDISEVVTTILSIFDSGNIKSSKALNAKVKASEWSIKIMAGKYEKIYITVVNKL